MKRTETFFFFKSMLILKLLAFAHIDASIFAGALYQYAVYHSLLVIKIIKMQLLSVVTMLP